MLNTKLNLEFGNPLRLVGIDILGIAGTPRLTLIKIGEKVTMNFPAEDYNRDFYIQSFPEMKLIL